MCRARYLASPLAYGASIRERTQPGSDAGHRSEPVIFEGLVSPPRRPVALKRALAELAARDADLQRILDEHGAPPPRPHPAGFAGLARIIVAQQIAAGAARAIRARLEAACPEMTAEAFLALDDDTLRAVGLSRSKIAYSRAAAEAVTKGRLDLDALRRCDDDTFIAALTEVKGIGRWTAEIYLLFALRRPDIWPTGDLAVRRGLAAAKGLDGDPDPAAMDAIAAPWRPYRSAAARLMWHYYGALRRRDVAPD